MPYRKSTERIERSITLPDRDKKPDYSIDEDVVKRFEEIYPRKVPENKKEGPVVVNLTSEN